MKVKLGSFIKIMQGYAFKTKNYVKKSKFRLVTLGNFAESGNCFKYNNEKAIFYGADFPSKVILQEGDLILPLTEQVVGLFGNSAFVPNGDGFQFVLNQRVGKVILINDRINMNFLHYLLATDSVKKQLEARANGTKQRNISPDDIYDVVVDLPNINLQKKIGNLFYNIEKKQKINNQINTQLEELAKTIYDYWFLQFEFPNEEGKPYKSSGGKMVYNEQLKREIPEGWKTRTLNNSNLFTIIKQGVDYFSKKNYLATANVIDNNIIDGNLISYENREGRANMQPRLNSVWFAKMKNSRKHIFISQSDQWMVDKYIISTGFTGLQCNTITFPYVYSYINSDYFEKVKDYRASGSTQEGIGDDDLILFSIVEPIEQTLVSYSKLVGGLIEKMNKLRLENQYLSSLRDFLLPILMNGQVTFKDENEELESGNKKSAAISYIERFNQWKQMQGYAARGDVDDEILMKIFDAMDEDDKK